MCIFLQVLYGNSILWNELVQSTDMFKFLFKLILVIVVILLIIATAWFGYRSTVKKKATLFTPITIPTLGTDIQATTSPFVLFDIDMTTPASSTIDISSWKSYKNDILGFQVSYPDNLITNGDDSSTILAFPKDEYFSWPLQDDLKITISASTACQTLLNSSPIATTSSFTLNEHTFTRQLGQDIAVGNRYLEIIDTTIVNGICYSIYLFDRGANGAGLYVDDQELIKRYDADYLAHMKVVMEIFNAITANISIFKLNLYKPSITI